MPFTVAALGGEVEVPTLDGYAMVKIGSGMESGKIFRLRGKGMPHIGGGRGDLSVEMTVEVPGQMNSRQRSILKEMEEELSESSYPSKRRIKQLAEEMFRRKSQLESARDR